jgi:arsenate reductase
MLCPGRSALGMSAQPYNVLFLCTGNSARSILAEAILKKDGAGRFNAFSAGSFPKGAVQPEALRLLGELGFPTEGYRSKSWDEFAAEGAPELDFVFTVCDNAAGEVCPVWPGQPMTAHWGIEDPAAVEGDKQAQAFRNAFYSLQRRIQLFLALPLESIDELSLQTRLRDIGRISDKTPDAA